MNLGFWAKVGFAIMFAGLILDIWIGGKADSIIAFGFFTSFSCFIDIERKRKELQKKVNELEKQLEDKE